MPPGCPLLDLRRGRALDAVYRDSGVPGNAPPASAGRRAPALAAGALLGAATVLYALAPSLALPVCALLAAATVLAVPFAFAGVLRCAHLLAERRQSLSMLSVALTSLRSTTLRSLALAATGALALFGSVALGGARTDLLHGIGSFAHAYSADAPVWVGNPGDNQAVLPFRARPQALARVPGVARVESFYGTFVQLGDRRVWLLARPPGGADRVLAAETVQGGARAAAARLAAGGWVVVSAQLAAARHVAPGHTFALPTPSGVRRLRLAATTTNLAWSPGAILLGAADYRRLWHTAEPTALAIYPRPGIDPTDVRARVTAALTGDTAARASDGSGASGQATSNAAGAAAGALAAVTAGERERRIDALTGEGLGQLAEISDLLLAVAILALAAALGSAIWQRRAALAGLRLSGVRPRRLRAILLIEAALMLSAGCLTGALVGLYGELVIDRYLTHVTGFPVAGLTATARPIELLGVIAACVLALVAVPTWHASRVSPTFAFGE